MKLASAAIATAVLLAGWLCQAIGFEVDREPSQGLCYGKGC